MRRIQDMSPQEIDHITDCARKGLIPIFMDYLFPDYPFPGVPVQPPMKNDKHGKSGSSNEPAS